MKKNSRPNEMQFAVEWICEQNACACTKRTVAYWVMKLLGFMYTNVFGKPNAHISILKTEATGSSGTP